VTQAAALSIDRAAPRPLEIAGQAFDFPIAIAVGVITSAPGQLFRQGGFLRAVLRPSLLGFPQGALGRRTERLLRWLATRRVSAVTFPFGH